MRKTIATGWSFRITITRLKQFKLGKIPLGASQKISEDNIQYTKDDIIKLHTADFGDTAF